MLKCFFSLSLMLMCVSFLNAQNKIDGVIAIVGEEIILGSDVEAQLELMKNQSQSALPDNARCLIFDQLLTNALVLAEAEKDSVFADDVEVEARLDANIQQILAYMGGSEEQFYTFYGMTPQKMKEVMRDDMKKKLTTEKMQMQIAQSVFITPKEVKEFFAKIPEDSLPYFNSEVELGEIIVKPKPSVSAEQAALEKAQNIRKQIVEDSVDFAELAKMYSHDPGSAARGGDLGMVPRGSFVPEFEATAYQLRRQEVSEIVKTEYGYHIIQLIERLGNRIHTRHILIRPEITDNDVELAKNYLDSVRTLILQDSFTFDQAIQKFSQEETSKTQNGQVVNPMTGEPYIETGDLDPEIYFAIDGLDKGEISDPIPSTTQDGKTQFKIVKIRNRTTPHVANLKDDYSRIQKAALEEKKARHLSDWAKRKIKNHYIEVKPLLNVDCTGIMDKWMRVR